TRRRSQTPRATQSQHEATDRRERMAHETAPVPQEVRLLEIPRIKQGRWFVKSLPQPLANPCGFDILQIDIWSSARNRISRMKRREFNTLLSGTATTTITWPLVTLAQRVARIPRVGYLSPLSASADATRSQAFRQGLRELGYTEAQNVVVEY